MFMNDKKDDAERLKPSITDEYLKGIWNIPHKNRTSTIEEDDE